MSSSNCFDETRKRKFILLAASWREDPRIDRKLETQIGKPGRRRSEIIAPGHSNVCRPRSRCHRIKAASLIVGQDQIVLFTKPEGFALNPVCNIVASPGPVNNNGSKAFAPDAAGHAGVPAFECARVEFGFYIRFQL